MHEGASHLLAQVPLAVSPFVPLPRAPSLPHNYTTLPSTLPPSILDAPDGAYISSAGGFAARPDALRAQNAALLEQLKSAPEAGRKAVQQWTKSIEERDLAERRRVAPGWLDSQDKLLRPETSTPAPAAQATKPPTAAKDDAKVSELGDLMDRAFG